MNGCLYRLCQDKDKRWSLSRVKTVDDTDADLLGVYAGRREVVSDECEPVSVFADEQVLGDEKVAPLAKSGVAFLLEPDSCVDVPLEVEVIVH